MDRRCTLSCQGCHVNPNGGGLRSGYGKWNEDRWLSSFRTSVLQDARNVAPTEKQHYGRGPKERSKVEGEENVDKDSEKDDGSEKSKRRAKKKKRMPRAGYPLIEVDDDYVGDEKYKRDGREFEVVDDDEFLAQIPQQDPYRILEDAKTDAGADIRWQWAAYKRDSAKTWSNFLMAADFGLRWRPVYRNVHFVYESRSEGAPSEQTKVEGTLTKPKTRSLYVMVDNLPFNVFVMGGYYRPLFGNFVPDHYALAQMITSTAMTGSPKNYGILYNAVSIGTAPNVPYLNVHAIQTKVGDKDDRTKGFAANAGMRFVSFGASLNYSYWRTTDKRDNSITGVEMHSIGAAGKLARTVMSIEGVSVSRDVDTTDFRQGGVYALDTYTQLWREMYYVFAFNKSNVAVDISSGSADQMKTGVRAFLTPGVDVMLLYELTNETRTNIAADTSEKYKSSGVTGQLHLFF